MGLMVLAGCQTQQVMTHGIPNLAQVEPGLWRGGQPTEEGWQWLNQQGITNVVKLNPVNEGVDDYARALGMKVYAAPITIQQQLGLAPIFHGAIAADVSLLRTPGTYVHCAHGQDRTGLIVAAYRVRSGWGKDRAEQEMMEHGFHKELIGLWDYWEKFK